MKFIGVVTGIALLVLTSGTTVAAPRELAVQDDWNDGDWHPIVPAGPQWEWAISSGFNNLDLEAGAGPAGDNAVRWEPRNKNKTNRSLSLSGLGAGATETEEWSLKWDEEWMPTDKGRDGNATSNPVITLGAIANGSSGPITGEWKLSRRLHSTYDLQITGTFGGMLVVQSEWIEYTDAYPSGFNPAVAGTYYRYRLKRVLNKIHLTATRLDSAGKETSDKWMLATVDASLDGKPTLQGFLQGETQYLTDLEIAATKTEDGFDARIDNLELAVLDSDERPATYQDFVGALDYHASLDEAIAGETHIFLPQGSYTIDNPITIDRTSGLHLHGAGNSRTSITAANAGEPLFEVAGASRITVAGLKFYPKNKVYGAAEPMFRFQNTEPVTFEMQNSGCRGPVADIEGPGEFILQAVHATGGYAAFPYSDWSPHAVKLNNPSAELYMLGGNYTFSISQVDQYQGHFEVYGSFMGAHGPIDTNYPDAAHMVLRAPSQIGTHMIAGMRVEGTGRSDESRYLYVPSSTQAIDVVVKGNEISYSALIYPASDFCNSTTTPGAVVTYNGEGTVWLLGNLSYGVTNQLAKGTTVDSEIVAIGNFVGGCVDPGDPGSVIDVTGATEYYAANQLDYNVWYLAHGGDPLSPTRRFINPGARLSDYTSVPAVPQNAAGGDIPKLDMPIMDEKTPSGFLVSIMDQEYCGSEPQPVEDYAPCIQAALIAEGANLYFPAGTYPIGTTLDYSQTIEAGSGGLIAGAGPDKTVITMAAAEDGPMFRSRGMHFVQFNGIAFEIQEDRVSDGTPVMSLQNLPLQPGECEWPLQPPCEYPLEDPVPPSKQFVTTLQNTFNNCRFTGGKYGVAIGTEAGSLQQGDTHLVVDSIIEKAHVGFVSGSDNSMDNVVHGVSFRDNNYNLGIGDIQAGEEDGGSYGVFSATGTGTRIAVIRGKNGKRAQYINKLISDGPQLFSYGWNTNALGTFFDHADLDGGATPTDPYLYYRGAMGFTFLHSTVNGGDLQYADSVAKALISLHSTIANWGTADMGSGCPVPYSQETCIAIQDDLP